MEGGVIQALAGLAVGAGALSLLMNDDVKEKIQRQVGDVVSGAAEKLISQVVVPLSKAAVSAVADSIQNNPVMSAFGFGGASTAASRIAKSAAGMARDVGFGKAASGASTASRYMKVASRGLPALGGAIDFGSRMMQGQSFGQATTGAGFSMAGAAGGAAIGATAGSVVPVVGTAIGGIVVPYLVGGLVVKLVTVYITDFHQMTDLLQQPILQIRTSMETYRLVT